MDKIARFSGVSFTGSPHIHLVEPGTGHGLNETASLGAHEEHLPQVIELIEAIQPQEGSIYLVNSAVVAGEFSGYNKRADWFNESGLKHTPPGFDDIPLWDIEARRKAAAVKENIEGWGKVAWGHSTFYNSHRFRHHVNKDPNKAYGYVLGSFWDPRMKRVVLVSELVKSMCDCMGASRVYDQLEAGEFPDTSMGCSTPFDECSICRHRARTPANYCKHMRRDHHPEYGPKKLLPDGRRVGVKTYHPSFFDDSFVLRGAERAAKVTSNVTSLVKGNRVYNREIYGRHRKMNKMASSPVYDPNIEATIEAAASNVMVNTKEEKAALRYYTDMLRITNRVVGGETPEAVIKQLDIMWKQQFVLMYGMPVDTFYPVYEKLEEEIKRLSSRQNVPVPTKTASSKLAEMLKEIPSDNKSLSVVKSQIGSMKPMSSSMLAEGSKRPGDFISTCSAMGVVLSPREYRDVSLPSIDPDYANRVVGTNRLFRPHDMSTCPYAPKPMSSSIIPSILSAIKGILSDRSFHPSAVRVRIHTPRPQIQRVSSRYESNPVMNRLAEDYSNYRMRALEDISSPFHREPSELRTHLPSIRVIKLAGDEEVNAEDVSSALYAAFPWHN